MSNNSSSNQHQQQYDNYTNNLGDLNNNFSNINLNNNEHHSDVKLKTNNDEPNENDANSVLIAIKLPNGEVVKRYFLKNDVILNVVKYASVKANIDFTKDNYILMEMPKKSIDNFSKTIEDYDLKNRTMLHIVQN